MFIFGLGRVVDCGGASVVIGGTSVVGWWCVVGGGGASVVDTGTSVVGLWCVVGGDGASVVGRGHKPIISQICSGSRPSFKRSKISLTNVLTNAKQVSSKIGKLPKISLQSWNCCFSN